MIAYSEENPPALDDNITVACAQLNIVKGGWLVEFWSAHNGAMLNDRVLIYSTEYIAERNETYQVNINFPDHILVGDDSGGYLILIPKAGSIQFYYLDSGDPFIDDAEIYESIECLVDAVTQDEDSAADVDIGNIVSIAQLKPKLSDVFLVKKALGLDLSIIRLAEILGVKNYVVLQGVNVNKYKDALVRYNHLISFIN